MAATGITVSQGAQGTSTITVTPASGYKGTVNILPSASTASFCYSATQAVVSGTTAATATLTIDTNLLDCQGASVRSHGMHLFVPGGRKAQNTHASTTLAAFGIAGIFFAGLIGWRFRRSRLAACVFVLGLLGFVLSGCGGGSSSNSNDTPKGTYTVTLTGTDSTTSTITANTTMSLTVN